MHAGTSKSYKPIWGGAEEPLLLVDDGWPTLVGVFRFCGTEEREDILNNNTIELLQCGLHNNIRN